MAETHAIERVHPPKLLMRAVNPLIRVLAQHWKVVQSHVLVLHFRGRKSDRTFDLPVGYRLIDGRILLFTNSSWRHNFRGGSQVEVTFRGRRQPAYVTLQEDPELVARVYEDRYRELSPSRALRELGIRVNVDRPPTHEEWLDVVSRSGMAIVEVTLTDSQT